ncbi:MAG: hypothetical protein K2K52_05295, partial [Paramuribaculum sp.]|nr:hypothetical protein [Paramuribaculum sp.]
MKSIFKVITLLFVLAVSVPTFAQNNEEITLTVSSDGPTKDEAVKNALRSALEQAYGAFVSANTTILNDEMVKDEIVTISTGAIKEYKIVSESEKPEGKGYMVTVKATVSLPHLITYAKNHGSECEFAGNTFGMQMKIYEMQKDNEAKILENLTTQVQALLPELLTWEIEISEPKVDWDSDEYIIESKIYALIQPQIEKLDDIDKRVKEIMHKLSIPGKKQRKEIEQQCREYLMNGIDPLTGEKIINININ